MLPLLFFQTCRVEINTVPFAYISSSIESTYADGRGIAFITISDGDTLRVEAVGYRKSEFPITCRRYRYAVDLEEESIHLPPVEITERYREVFSSFSVQMGEGKILTGAMPMGKIEEALWDLPFISFEGKDYQGSVPAVRGLSGYRTAVYLGGMRVFTDREIGGSMYFCPPGLIRSADVIYSGASALLGSGAVGGAVVYGIHEPGEPSEISASYNHSASTYSIYGAAGGSRFYAAAGFSGAGDYNFPDTAYAGRIYALSSMTTQWASYRKMGGMLSTEVAGGLMSILYCGVRDLKRALLSTTRREYPADDEFFIMYSRDGFFAGYQGYRWITSRIKADTSRAHYRGHGISLRYNRGKWILDLQGRFAVNSDVYVNGQWAYRELDDAGYVIPAITYVSERDGFKVALRNALYIRDGGAKYVPSVYVSRSLRDFTLSFSGSYRFPELVETDSYSPRTLGFLVGNPSLRPEKSLEMDAVWRRGNATLSAFALYLMDLIDEVRLDSLSPSGDTIYTFSNVGNLFLYGLTAMAKGNVKSVGWKVTLSAIPSISVYGVGEVMHPVGAAILYASVEGVLYRRAIRTLHVDRPGYVMLNAGLRGTWRRLVYDLRFFNINNAVAYRSTDPLSVPLPSRSIMVSVSLLGF